MNRRRLRTWTAWLLPLLVLRAVLPVGFMLSAESGELSLSFCPAQGPALVTASEMSAAADADHHLQHSAQSGANHHGGDQAAHEGGASIDVEAPCPYGLACLALALDVAHLAIEAPVVVDPSFPPSPASSPIFGPTRVDFIRGPPALS